MYGPYWRTGKKLPDRLTTQVGVRPIMSAPTTGTTGYTYRKTCGVTEVDRGSQDVLMEHTLHHHQDSLVDKNGKVLHDVFDRVLYLPSPFDVLDRAQSDPVRLVVIPYREAREKHVLVNSRWFHPAGPNPTPPTTT